MFNCVSLEEAAGGSDFTVKSNQKTMAFLCRRVCGYIPVWLASHLLTGKAGTRLAPRVTPQSCHGGQWPTT